MNTSIFHAILVTGFSVAFFHAAIPTHWLPFVLTARVQKWSRSKTLLVTALAGLGHVLFTALLGFLLAWGGISLSAKVGSLFPLIAGGALILFGLYYIVQQLKGKGHSHSRFFGGGHHHSHSHDESEKGPQGGILVNTGHGYIELTVFETGVPPHFRIFFYNSHKALISAPGEGTFSIETLRPDEQRQSFSFIRENDYLRSTTDIPEPHEFQAIVTLRHGDHAHTYKVPFSEDDHHHDHSTECSHHHHEELPPVQKSDWAAIASLLVLLTFSPCEGFLPIYVSGIQYGWSGFFLLTLILSLATVLGMVVFTALTLFGLGKLKLGFLEKYESGLMGAILVILGLAIILLEY